MKLRLAMVDGTMCHEEFAETLGGNGIMEWNTLDSLGTGPAS